MTNIIDFPTSDVVETPINHNALMDFAAAWAIDTEEELTALNEWMVQHHLNDLEDDEEDDPTPTILENTIYPKLVVEFLEEHDVRCDEDMEEFSQMINLLTAEPNVPLLVVN
jgi:hypothetical protein